MINKYSILIVILCSAIFLTSCYNDNIGKSSTSKPINITSSAGSSSDIVEQIVSVSSIKIPFSSEGSFNPFTTTSQYNKIVSSLLFDPLVKLNVKYQPENWVCNSIVAAGKTLTVTIKNNILFSDGSLVTANDVVNSFMIAKTPSSYYYKSLSNIASAKAVNDSTIAFDLLSEDKYASNLLTFPIIKKGSEQSKIPTGCGRFLVDSVNQNKLIANKSHYIGSGKIETVDLVSLENDDMLDINLKLGNIDCYFSDTEAASISKSPKSGTTVSLNNLIFLGVNPNSKLLSNYQVRAAINSSIDRGAIASAVYSGKAYETVLPYNPQFYDIEKINIDTSANLANSVAALEQAGYNKVSQSGIRTDGANSLVLNIIVNKNNIYKCNIANMISNNLSRVGINSVIKEYEFTQFKQEIINNRYDLYIGEVKLYNNMDILPLLNNTMTSEFGNIASQQLLTSYSGARSGIVTNEVFMDGFLKELPFIPLVFKEATVSFSRNFSSHIVATEQDIFYNINNW